MTEWELLEILQLLLQKGYYAPLDITIGVVGKRIDVTDKDFPNSPFSIYGDYPNVRIIHEDGSLLTDDHKVLLKHCVGYIYKNRYVKDLLNNTAYVGCDLQFYCDYYYFKKYGILYELGINDMDYHVRTSILSEEDFRCNIRQTNFTDELKYTEFINTILCTTRVKSAQN